MKKQVLAVSIAAMLAGCQTTSLTRKPTDPLPSPTPPVTKAQEVAAQGMVEAPMTIKIPPWYIKAPAATEEFIWVTGTAVSNHLSMSRTKAMLDAQAQLADKLNGLIDGVVRQSIKDNNGQVNQEYTSSVIRKKLIETSLTGHMLEDSTIQPENRGYRTFVLVRYPIGDANKLLKEKLGSGFDIRSDQDIDREINKIMPQGTPSAPAQAAPTPGAVNLVPGNNARLLNVDNEEYKARRAEVLRSPNAVVGNITVR
jgi:hypothetical protein